jgi:hypothetical protein
MCICCPIIKKIKHGGSLKSFIPGEILVSFQFTQAFFSKKKQKFFRAKERNRKEAK